MKKILIFEYITGGGLIENKLNQCLLREANIILDSLIDNSNNIVHFFCDHRHKYRNHKHAIVVTPYNKDIIYNTDLINSYDYFLPICPETDLISNNYIKKIASQVSNTELSNHTTLLVTSDKLQLKKICKKNNIANADSYIQKSNNKLYIVKDRIGCGCNNVELTKKKLNTLPLNKISENYIPGKSYSVNLYISDYQYKLISINQQCTKRHGVQLKLEALKVNINLNFRKSIYKFIDNILLALPGLRGFVGFDFIYNNNQIYLIEVNARFTTSMSAIRQCKGTHILDYIDTIKNEQVGMTCQINI